MNPKGNPMILELKTALAVREEPAGPQLTSPEQIHKQLEDMKHLAQETFVTLTFTTKNRLIARHLISLGTLDSTLVHPREVFRPAITDGAANLVLAHNHPSGDPSPSADDIRITRTLIEAGKQIEIGVLDHLIVGSSDFLSLRESGLVQFT
jgi:DNA repair protein RadC